jgi:hypothetical protein
MERHPSRRRTGDPRRPNPLAVVPLPIPSLSNHNFPLLVFGALELRRHIVEHLLMSDDLTDDDFATLAAASFRALDEEEAQRA